MHDLLRVGPSHRRDDPAVEAVQGQVEQRDVHHHRGPFDQRLVGRVIDKQGERRQVVGVVGTGQPLAEAEAEAVRQPDRQLRLRGSLMASTRAAVIAEDARGVQLPGQIFGNRRGDLVTLRPQRHRIAARLEHRVAEAEDRLGGLIVQMGRELAGHHAFEQQQGAMIGRVEPRVDDVDEPPDVDCLQGAGTEARPWCQPALVSRRHSHEQSLTRWR
ncbi:hypothetical protein SDC9_114915 [bioreactor metagenome]|uniref:Uncharacterized protein n=1 Tax=bioreactor metagenome TaxID=1076179 RepID=A0A645BRD7_9ZZZZ